MKKMIALTLVFVLFILAIGWAGNLEHYYTRRGCEVISVWGDYVRVEDRQGNIWAFYGEGFKDGEKVNLRMFNNYTERDCSDDEIVKVK